MLWLGAVALCSLVARANATAEWRVQGKPTPDTGGCDNGTACPANFSAHFQTHMVLQSAPSRAAVYGMAPVAGATVRVTLLWHAGGAGSAAERGSSTATATVGPSLTWKVLLPTQHPGGNFSVSVACTVPAPKKSSLCLATHLTVFEEGEFFVAGAGGLQQLCAHDD